MGSLKRNVMNGMRQMSARWLDGYGSDILNGVIRLGLQGVGDENELKRFMKEFKVEAYLLGAMKEWTDWRIRGFRLMALGDDEVLPDASAGGFPEITNEHIVR